MVNLVGVAGPLFMRTRARALKNVVTRPDKGLCIECQTLKTGRERIIWQWLSRYFSVDYFWWCLQDGAVRATIMARDRAPCKAAASRRSPSFYQLCLRSNMLCFFPTILDCTSVSIVLSSADENVTVRSTVLLVCVAYGGTNAPNIVWYRNGRPVNNATDLRVSFCTYY